MTRRTVFLARLIGIYCLLMALTLSAHKQDSLIALGAIAHSPDIMLVTGIITLVAGLALVIGHNVWSGGAPVIVVTLIGWVLVIRSVLVLLLPSDAIGVIYDAIGVDHYFYLLMAIAGVIGLFLTWSSFRGVKAVPPGAL